MVIQTSLVTRLRFVVNTRLVFTIPEGSARGILEVHARHSAIERGSSFILTNTHPRCQTVCTSESTLKKKNHLSPWRLCPEVDFAPSENNTKLSTRDNPKASSTTYMVHTRKKHSS